MNDLNGLPPSAVGAGDTAVPPSKDLVVKFEQIWL